MSETFYVTQQGLEELKAELDHLIHVTRAEVIQELQEARAQGDLSENADYDAARDRQARVEARIQQLEAQIKNAEVIREEPTQKGKQAEVRLGATVTVKDLADDEVSTYTIVGTVESDPFVGRISNDSPFAKAIMDKKAGDIVTVRNVAEPYQVEILKVE